MRLTRRDLMRLEGIHSGLLAVVAVAAARSPLPFVVLEGLRSEQRQRELVARGVSRTLHSRHLTGDAVDIAPIVNGLPSWDWDDYHRLAPHIKAAASLIGVPVEWGGDWERFPDGPHWQIASE